ncbi:MAG: VacJ family lipoprotein, partial [SAR324 cluster bacterium]|nr:VacJ family lipoprotein [SAR324 cluster bacterium]
MNVENSFIDYFKESTEIYQGMKVIDQQLGGTTPLDLVVNLEQSKDEVQKEDEEVNADSEIEDEEEFDEFEEEFGSSGEEVFDPLSGYNGVMTEFNDGFYVYFVDPVARGYRWVLPYAARSGVKNFFHNLLFPLRFVNNALQLKIKNAGEEFLRFSINSTIGILGFWDPAKDLFGLEAHEEDFGQTLGYYGVGGGFHVVLPFLGPSNLRDMFSLYPDMQMDP